MYSLHKEREVGSHLESENASIFVSTFREGLNATCVKILHKALFTNQFLRKSGQKVLHYPFTDMILDISVLPCCLKCALDSSDAQLPHTLANFLSYPYLKFNPNKGKTYSNFCSATILVLRPLSSSLTDLQ